MRELNQTTQFANSTSPLCRPDRHADHLLGTTKLLVSVRNTSEAGTASEAGVDWVDLKEPHAGALGRPSLTDAVAIAMLLKGHSQRSAALGELFDLDPKIAIDFAPHFPVLKVGLSHVGNSVVRWQSRFESLADEIRKHGSELIPVAYADWSMCDAPNVDEVQRIAQHVGANYMLIDTFVKDGRGLLDWLSVEELQHIIQSACAYNCGVVLAGSLKIADVPELLKLRPAALAVRGAVCRSEPSATQSAPFIQSRTTSIDPDKVALWRRSI